VPPTAPYAAVEIPSCITRTGAPTTPSALKARRATAPCTSRATVPKLAIARPPTAPRLSTSLLRIPRPPPVGVRQIDEMLPGAADTRNVSRWSAGPALTHVFVAALLWPPMSQPNGIEVERLVRVFKKGPRAVDGIDLEVAPGEIYGFLGPNGAGKSTTVLMLTTLLPPTEGTARVAGFDVVHEGASVRKAIGAALQEAALDPFLTGREHMRLQAGLHGLDRAERDRRAGELLARVGLTEAADRKVGGYSGGMKRRLDLGLALVHRPRILFLDEPTTGLDPQSRSALWEEVERLSTEDGVTVFLTTQYLEEADVLADRVGIIDHGRIVAEGTPAQLKAEIGRSSIEVVPAREADGERLAAVLERFGERTACAPTAVAVRFGDGDDLTDVVRALDAEDIEIAHLAVHEPTLDDVFLAKTGRSLEGAGEEEDAATEPVA
jgi:ABC-2 type transport system ATP-binding protein